jgi:hypothetical protein
MDPLTALLDQSSLTAEKVESLARIQGYRRRLNAAGERANRARSAAMYFVHSRLHGLLDRQYQAEVRRFDALPAAPGASMVRVTPKVRAREDGALWEDIASGWMRSSRLMQQMLAARGARYVHLLQPNQYFTTRPFAPGEAEVALAADSPFKPGAERGYPALERLVASGAFCAGRREVRGRRAPVRRRARAGLHRQLLPLHAPRLRDPRRRDCECARCSRGRLQPPWAA